MRASLGFGAGQCFEVGVEGATDEEAADFSFRSDAIKNLEELLAMALLGGLLEWRRHALVWRWGDSAGLAAMRSSNACRRAAEREMAPRWRLASSHAS